jgi:putative transposase
LQDLAQKRSTRGFDDYYGRIRREGKKWNRKRALRVYRMLHLHLRRKSKKRVPSRDIEPLEL